MNKHSFSLKIHNLAMTLSIGMTFILFVFAPMTSAQTEAQSEIDDDKLAYVSQDDQLMLYDPRTRTETKLLDNVQDFLIARNGRVAFRKLDDSDTDLYVFDPSTPNLDPVNISQNPIARHYPLAWSPDGHYLAFGLSGEDRSQSLYIWDGKTTTNIMPDDVLDPADKIYVEWSLDGRLAFELRHDWSTYDTPSEIYLWDGKKSISLSQNPIGYDSAIGWSKNGKFMFGSQRDGVRGIYIWDGVAFKDHSPDINSFIHLAPELESISVSWAGGDLIAFTHPLSLSGEKEIMLWDLERQGIVKKFPVTSEHLMSSLAEGGQVVLSSKVASGLPSFYLDVENVEGEILFSKTHIGEYAWSSSGYLAFCDMENGTNWDLSIWDGKDTWAVVKITNRPAQWQNRQEKFSCSYG